MLGIRRSQYCNTTKALYEYRVLYLIVIWTFSKITVFSRGLGWRDLLTALLCGADHRQKAGPGDPKVGNATFGKDLPARHCADADQFYAGGLRER